MARTGRPERPLDTVTGALRGLADELRRLRGDRTYRELAAETGRSTATLRAAASGEHLPTWKVTSAFTAACGGDADTVRKLWEEACRAAGQPVPDDYHLPAGPPVPVRKEVTSARQLVDMMKSLRRWADNPSLAELNKRAGGHNLLPPSTVSDILNGQRLPRLELVLAFVRACGLDDDQIAAWKAAWAELKETEGKQTEGKETEVEQPAPLAVAKPHEPVYGRIGWTVGADFVCALTGTLAASWLRFGDNLTGTYVALDLALPLAWLAALRVAGAYDVRYTGVSSEEYRKIFNTGIKLLAAIAICSWALHINLSRGYLLIALLSITLLELIARYAMRKHLHRLRAAGRRMLSVVAVGHEMAVADLIRELRRDQYHGLSVAAACLARMATCQEVAGVPVYGGFDDVPGAVRAFDADTVVVLACPEMDGIRLRALAWELEKTGTELCVSPALLDVAGPRTTVRPTAGLTLLHVDHPQLTGGQQILKALFDRCAAAVLLILLAAPLAVLAAAIWLSDRGPALFTEIRVGKGGRKFRIYKFRTMVVDAEQQRAQLLAREDLGAILFKLRRDPRVTPVGAHLRRWSIDELPQLFNILRGDMSLVGPRAALADEAARYADHVRRRLVVKPGLTGLWQVNGRSDLSWDESVRLDLRYVESWSFALDLQIIWKTITTFARGSGAY
jgi:exopolysaccharide biosynthesis polyprenyl glycosylphosphotransferase